MKFTDAKQDGDIALAGITAEVEWHDKTAKAITLTDTTGRVVRIAKGEYGSLDVLVPAPPVYVDTWRLSGRIPGIDAAVLEFHDYEHGANARRDAIRSALRVQDELKVEKVRATEEEIAAHREPQNAPIVEIPF